MATYQTTQEQIDYYANLLPAQYITQPNAYATIQVLAYLGLMPQDGGLVYDNNGNVVVDNEGNPVTVLDPWTQPILPLAVAQAFNIQTAVGEQLQFMAEAVGAKNTGYNLSGQFVTLSDSDFRLLVAAASARNYLRATTNDIVTFVTKYFSGVMSVVDQLDMRMSFLYYAALGTKLWAELFITQGFLPRPLGVEADITQVVLGPFFGGRTYALPAPAGVLPGCTYGSPTYSANPVLLYKDGLGV